MTITDLDHKNVCIIGYAREGQALAKALGKYAPNAKITVADKNTSVKVPDHVATQLGTDYLKNLDRFDIIVRSMGVPNLPELDAVKAKTTNSTLIFFDTIAGSGVKIIGVTGSKGKSTTSNLIYHALAAANKNVYLMGNIGEPMIHHLDHAKLGATFVIELSSYMLEHLRVSPHIAVITSFFVEHLDRHGSVNAYLAAKQNIAAHQTKDDFVVFNADYPQCRQMALASPGTKIGYTAKDFPLPIEQTLLRGEHNRSNLAAAYKVAILCDVPEQIALKSLSTTSGLPYRLRSLGVMGGIEWVDDSLATAPEATLFAIQALGDSVNTLITGGLDRGGYDFTELGRIIAKSAIKNIVLFPQTGEAIKTAVLAAGGKDIIFYDAKDMASAIEFAKAHTKKDSICLLSNASPSYNMFKNHEDKSRQFAEAIGV